MTCDVTLCLDATGSMGRLIDVLIDRLPTMLEKAAAACERAGEALRVRAVVYRDFSADPEPIMESCFYEIPTEGEELLAFLKSVWAAGGGDLPEDGLEALALSLQTEGDAVARRAVVLFTDSPAHPLGEHAWAVSYPDGMPRDLAELHALFSGVPCRLSLFAPNVEPWCTLAAWEEVTHFPVTVSELYYQLSEEDMTAGLMDAINM